MGIYFNIIITVHLSPFLFRKKIIFNHASHESWYWHNFYKVLKKLIKAELILLNLLVFFFFLLLLVKEIKHIIKYIMQGYNSNNEICQLSKQFCTP